VDASLNEALARLAVVGLGLSAGALLAEAGVLVPFWRSLEPAAFLAWYRQNAARLLRFFGPLEVATGVGVVAATVSSWLGGHPGSLWWACAALLTLAVLASFPAYFRAANQSFAEGTIALEAVADELRRWSAWHWGRTLLAGLAFAASVLAVAAAR
jgi:hypothetical protein